MTNVHLRNIINSFQGARLVSLSSLSMSAQVTPRDRGGPYMVTREGFDAEDLAMIASKFVLSKSGKWFSLAMFHKMPMEVRRAKFVFGTAAEVLAIIRDLPPKPGLLRSGKPFKQVRLQLPSNAKQLDRDRKTRVRGGRNFPHR